MMQLLRRLGIDRRNLRTLPLLPLVEVAWADGQIQPSEEALIRQKAEERRLRPDERMLLDDWLRHAPSPAYLREARLALSWLRRHGDPAVDPRTLATLRDDAVAVARSAGGWFGFGSVSKSERDVLARLTRALTFAPPMPAHAEASPPAFPVQTEVELHPDFAKRNNCVTLAYDANDINGDAALEPVFESSLRIPVRPAGTIVGSAQDADVRVVGDDDVRSAHVMLYATRSGYVAKALEGALWINGERATERRLLGGETLRITPAASFVFKWIRPMTG